MGVSTRRQQKQARDREEKFRESTGKLLSSSRKMIESHKAQDRQTDRPDYDEPEESLIGDFSSHDLIRHSIANPAVFDDPVDNSNTNELQIIPANEPLSSDTPGPSSSWSFSLNPFSYYM